MSNFALGTGNAFGFLFAFTLGVSLLTDGRYTLGAFFIAMSVLSLMCFVHTLFKPTR